MKHTKKALFTSVLALVLCMSMLVGSTFAWFTDTDTTAVSNIVSGTLELEIQDTQGNEKTTPLSFRNVNNETNILWEPGATFQTEQFQLKNVGNLWLKYKVEINGIQVSENKLNEAIDFYLIQADGTKTLLNNLDMKDIPLEPEASSGLLYIEGHMDENAGNEYKGLTLSGVSITIYAAQYTKEVDMTDDQYDKDAAYDKVVFANSQSDLNDAIANAPTQGDTIVNLPAGKFELDDAPLTNKDVTIAGGKDTVIDTTAGMPSTTGAVLTFEGVTIDFKAGGSYGTNGFTHTEKVVYKDCTINGTQFLYADAEFINCVFNVEGDAYAVWTYGASNATFTGCTFNTSGKAILVYIEAAHTATINVNNCTFKCDGDGYSKAAVEVGESAYGNKANYTINITGSTADTGFTTNKSTSNLWGNKNDMGASLIVTVDGTKVH